MKQAIVAILLELSTWNPKHENKEAYRERITSIAEGVSRASKGQPEMAALLIAIAKHESEFSRRVHQGDCPEGGCDGGRSATLWQIMYGSWLPRSRWLTFIGVELGPTARAAAYAAKVLERGLNSCKSVRGAISLYATGKTCYWRGKGPHGPDARVRTYKSVLSKLH